MASKIRAAREARHWSRRWTLATMARIGPSTMRGTAAHDVPLALPPGGTYRVTFFRLGRETGAGRLLIVERLQADHRAGNARIVRIDWRAWDADLRLDSSRLRSRCRNEMQARAVRHEAGDRCSTSK